MPVPKYDALINPLLEALRNLGGSAAIQEQEDEVASLLKLSEKTSQKFKAEIAQSLVIDWRGLGTTSSDMVRSKILHVESGL